MNVTFYDLLGIDPNAANRDGLARDVLPAKFVSLTAGHNPGDDRLLIVQRLQAGLVFKNIRPGVNAGANTGSGPPGQISFAADVHVMASSLTIPSTTFYLRELPHTPVQLVPTDPAAPAQLFVSVDTRGTEVIVDGLPLRISLKTGLVAPLDDAVPANDVSVGTPFAVDAPDGFAYVLRDGQPSEIDALVRLHLHPDGEVTIEASVPMSLGEMSFMGFPVQNLYDVQLIASPEHRELYEWTHNDIGSFVSNPRAKGALAFRSIMLDWSKQPLKDFREYLLKHRKAWAVGAELVLEDVVIPLDSPAPIPSHGTFGIRRAVLSRDDVATAYDFIDQPLQLSIYRSQPTGGSGGSALTLEIEQFLFRTGKLGAANPNDAPQIRFKAALIWERQRRATGSGLRSPSTTTGWSRRAWRCRRIRRRCSSRSPARLSRSSASSSASRSDGFIARCRSS